MRVLKCMILIVAIGVVLPITPQTANACCGVYPEFIYQDPVEACVGVEAVFSGTIRGTEAWADAYSTGPAGVNIEVEDPEGNVTVPPIVATLSNLQAYPEATPPYADWDYSASYTTPIEGLYGYAKTVWWTSALGWTEYTTAWGEFEATLCCGKVTGGGWIITPGLEKKNTFGFEAKCTDEGLQGNVEAQLHDDKVNLKSDPPSTITALAVVGNTATIRGTARINGLDGYLFELVVVDNGEPGKDNDTVSLTFSPAVNGLGGFSGTLNGGNIQVQ